MIDLSFWRGRRVLITGHTGFKGSWLTKILVDAGAEVAGYSTCRHREPSLFALAGLEPCITHVQGDVRDYASLLRLFESFRPEVVFHLAAQPIVREGYEDPLGTYGTNVMGTANVLECIRRVDSTTSAIIVTTDKVYRNEEWAWGYRESDALDGCDPYSNSKSCAELVVATYRRSYPDLPPISTVRAGNVLGGGDFARDRIIPDCVRATLAGEPIVVRNPNSVRPYQHVLEPLFAYLLLAERQAGDATLSGSYNIGPRDEGCITTGELVELFCKAWGDGASWTSAMELDAPHEAGMLRLDCSLIRTKLGWHPRWDIGRCIQETCAWYRAWTRGGDVGLEMGSEMETFLTSLC